MIRALVKHGASLSSVNLNGCTPLHTAAQSGNASCVITILEKVPARKRKYVNTIEARFGWTALHFAIMSRNIDCVNALMKAG